MASGSFDSARLRVVSGVDAEDDEEVAILGTMVK